MKQLMILLYLLTVSACVPTAAPEPAQTDLTSGVADLLQNRPAPGTAVEIDAYFSGVDAVPFPSPAADGRCPIFPFNGTLTDEPVLPTLVVLNGVSSNHLPDDAAWLVAVAPEGSPDDPPLLPFHGRLRGHLDDPDFAACPDAHRLFVVEEVTAVYEEKPTEPAGWPQIPLDLAQWQSHHNGDLGFTITYPPDWTPAPLAEEEVLGGLIMRPAHHPNYPVIVRVHEGETYRDQYDPASEPPLLQRSEAGGVYEQGWSFQEVAESQHLPGFIIERTSGTGELYKAALFSGNGRTYEIGLAYPTGFAAFQQLLTEFTIMVESFRLDVLPGPSPTPPIRQVLGPGPFITQTEAETAGRQSAGFTGQIEILMAELLAEAEARQRSAGCGSDFSGHYDGIWRLIGRGQVEGATRTIEMLVDATTGEFLCGAEIVPTPEPNFTPTPLLPGMPTPPPPPTPVP